MSRLAVAVNPVSGRGAGADIGDGAIAELRAMGHNVVRLVGVDAADLSQKAREQVIGGGIDALIVAGGDGMVNLGVNAVADTPTPLGIIAAGTGNDVARAFGLPVRDSVAAAEAISKALSDPAEHQLSVDVASCHDGASGYDRRFVGVMGLGFDTLVNERANEIKWPRGSSRYNLAMLVELPVFKPRHYELDLDGESWSGPAIMVTVANTQSYGGGMRICPEADPTDGLFDVLILHPISTFELLRVFPRVYAGTHLDHPAVEIRRCRSVRVDARPVSGKQIVGYADGERFASLPLHCELLPRALSVLTGTVRP